MSNEVTNLTKDERDVLRVLCRLAGHDPYQKPRGRLPGWASTLEAVSDSPRDSAMRTGARTVLVTGVGGGRGRDGHDVKPAEYQETVTLAGSKPKGLKGMFTAVRGLKVQRTGTGGTNAGTIELREAGSGPTIAMIPPKAGEAIGTCIRRVGFDYSPGERCERVEPVPGLFVAAIASAQSELSFCRSLDAVQGPAEFNDRRRRVLTEADVVRALGVLTNWGLLAKEDEGQKLQPVTFLIGENVACWVGPKISKRADGTPLWRICTVLHGEVWGPDDHGRLEIPIDNGRLYLKGEGPTIRYYMPTQEGLHRVGLSAERNTGVARHSPDFRSVHWYGTDYSFTAAQASIIALLWKAWETSTPDVGSVTLLKAAGRDEESRLVDIFRDHSSWGSMIVPGQTKASRCLVEPRKS